MLCRRPEFIRDMARRFIVAGIPAECTTTKDFHFQ